MLAEHRHRVKSAGNWRHGEIDYSIFKLVAVLYCMADARFTSVSNLCMGALNQSKSNDDAVLLMTRAIM